MDLKPIVFFNDHTSFVTNLTCTSEGGLYVPQALPAVLFCNNLNRYTTGLDRRICVYNAPSPPPFPLQQPVFVTLSGCFAAQFQCCCHTLCMYDQTNDGSVQYKTSKIIHDAGITSCV